MSPATAFRIGACGLVVSAMLVGLRGPKHVVSPQAASRATSTTVEPRLSAHQQRLRHCQAIGAAGAEDPECLAAWTHERERFLGANPRQSRER